VFDFKVCQKPDGQHYGIPDESDCGPGRKEVQQTLLTKEEKNQIITDRLTVAARIFNSSVDYDKTVEQWQKDLVHYMGPITTRTAKEDFHFDWALKKAIPHIAHDANIISDDIKQWEKWYKEDRGKIPPHIDKLFMAVIQGMERKREELFALGIQTMREPPIKSEKSWNLYKKEVRKLWDLEEKARKTLVQLYNAHNASLNQALDSNAWLAPGNRRQATPAERALRDIEVDLIKANIPVSRYIR
jgi:hypothetical protein